MCPYLLLPLRPWMALSGRNWIDWNWGTRASSWSGWGTSTHYLSSTRSLQAGHRVHPLSHWEAGPWGRRAGDPVWGTSFCPCSDVLPDMQPSWVAAGGRGIWGALGCTPISPGELSPRAWEHGSLTTKKVWSPERALLLPAGGSPHCPQVPSSITPAIPGWAPSSRPQHRPPGHSR